MSIFYICGKPGGGKSYLGVKQIIEELLDKNSNRYIVTNISLNLGNIASWLHDNCKHEVNLSERVRILDDAEAGEFWLFEPHREFEKRKTIEMRRRSYDVPDFEDRAERGTLYVIDEVHNYFGARDWQNTGNDATFFLSQHRKLLCDVIFITQHPEQTDKALRRLAQEYMTVRNLSREPILGFNLASWFGEFRFVRSLNSPQSPNPAVFDTGFVSLKPEVLGSFYDTMSGVGIAGRVAPQVKVRGRSLWWLFVPIGLFGIAAYYVFTHITEINHTIAGGLQKMIFKTATNAVPVVSLPVTPVAAVAPLPDYTLHNAAMNVLRQPQASVQTNIYCVGFAMLPHIPPSVFMSDGSVVTADDGLETIGKTFVVISGRKYKIHNATIPVYVPSSPVVFAQPPASADRPVNQAIILPAITPRYPDPPPRLNGISSMGRNGVAREGVSNALP